MRDESCRRKHERKSTIWQKYKYNDTKRWVEIVNLKKKLLRWKWRLLSSYNFNSYKILSLINFVKISIRNGFIKGWIYRTLDLIIVIRKYRTINFISKKWVPLIFELVGNYYQFLIQNTLGFVKRMLISKSWMAYNSYLQLL